MSRDSENMRDAISSRAITRKTAAATLTMLERHVEAVPPAASTYILTLPSAEAAAGAEFYVRSNGNDTGTVTVQSPEPTPVVNAILSADADEILVRSTGFRWVIVTQTLAGTRS